MSSAQLKVSSTLCVVMHDVSGATWPDCARLLAALGEVGPFRSTLLLVPEFYQGSAARRDVAFCRRMTDRLQEGDELALHGFRHHDDVVAVGVKARLLRSVYTAAEGEFAALSAQAARRRLLAGAQWFAENEWPLHGFVAPAWLLGTGAWDALKDFPLSYTTTLNRLYLLPGPIPVRAPSLVYSTRSPWRRKVSRRWVEILAHIERPKPLVRFGLHPADAHYPEVIRHWQDLLARFLPTHEVCTKAQTSARLHASLAQTRS
ncbi:MAG: polysaccharide deacetylase family protein [Burkholderiaceae bacterium]